MSKRGKPVDSKISCPWCGADYKHLTREGSYMRDKIPVPKYHCKACDRSFSSSVIKIAILKPPDEVEIGNKVKIEVKIKLERSFKLKEVSCEIAKSKKPIFSTKLEPIAENIYKGIWDTTDFLEGSCKLYIIVKDQQGYLSIQPRTIKVDQHYDVLIRKISEEYSIDPFLIKGLIWKESSFRPTIQSPAKAVGLMQLNEITRKDIKKVDHFDVVNPDDPEQNIRGGILYFKRMIRKYTDLRIALGAYNWGPDKVNKKAKKIEAKFPKSVKEYINDVLKYKNICEKKDRENYEN